jgi:hypothetical protein
MPCCNCDDYKCPCSVLQIGPTCGSAYIECATIGLFVAIATPSPIFVAAAAAVSHTTSRKRRNARVPPAVSIPGCVVPASTSACTTGCSSPTRVHGCACDVLCMSLGMRACMQPQHEGAIRTGGQSRWVPRAILKVLTQGTPSTHTTLSSTRGTLSRSHAVLCVLTLG